VIVPVYDDLAATRTCLEALLACSSDSVRSRIVVVDDRTPDPALAALLDNYARDGRVELLRNHENLGFAASVNRGLASLEVGEDAVVLNADTVPPRDLCRRLAAIAYSSPDIATVTPLSNNGEYTSLPVRFRANPLPGADELAALDNAAQDSDADPVELPNGIGFCLYVKRAVLDDIGLLSLQFGRGYYEDVDFCLRARAAGYRHVCAPQIFVGHAGSRSFGTEKRALVVRNLARLARLYPFYQGLSAAFVHRDPLRDSIAALELRCLQVRQRPFVLVVRSDQGDAAVAARYARQHEGLDTIVATVESGAGGMTIRLRDLSGGLPQNVVLACAASDVPAAMTDLARRCLAGLAIVDPDTLPEAFARRLAEMATGYDVVLSDANGLEGAKELLAGARCILPSSERLGRALIARAAGIADRCRPLLQEPAGETRWLAASQGVLLVAGGPVDVDSALVRSLAAGLLRADPGASIVIDGAMDETSGAMNEGNVFVLGRKRSGGESPLACRLPVAAVLFPSRRWGLGDARVEQVMTTGMPVAYVDPSVPVSRTAGRNLLLSARDRDASIVAALLGWWRGLTAPARARSAS
jgi:GT2 family glycosyltransferase